MAKRRMFSLDIIDTDKFLEMPATSQALYFHLGMRADDDGFISSPKKVTNIVNCSIDDLKILISKGYVIPFESGIVVVRHWHQNNYVRNDRYVHTIYTDEMSKLVINNGVYDISNQCGIPNDIPVVATGKVSIDKYSIDNNINIICSEPDKPTLNPNAILMPLNDNSLYEVPQKNIDTWIKAYPAVDVKHELIKIYAWLESNPTRRKTKRGINRFINTWLSKEQDKGGNKQQYSNTCDVARQQGQNKNSFNNFQKNDYDMNDLEKKLLSN